MKSLWHKYSALGAVWINAVLSTVRLQGIVRSTNFNLVALNLTVGNVSQKNYDTVSHDIRRTI